MDYTIIGTTTQDTDPAKRFWSCLDVPSPTIVTPSMQSGRHYIMLDAAPFTDGVIHFSGYTLRPGFLLSTNGEVLRVHHKEACRTVAGLIAPVDPVTLEWKEMASPLLGGRGVVSAASIVENEAYMVKWDPSFRGITPQSRIRMLNGEYKCYGFYGSNSAMFTRVEAAEPKKADSAPVSNLTLLEAELKRARAKFPTNQYLFHALAEEIGEMADEYINNGDSPAFRKEAQQVACVAERIASEGVNVEGGDTEILGTLANLELIARRFWERKKDTRPDLGARSESPCETHRKAQHETPADTFNFAQALANIGEGCPMRRESWGEGSYVTLGPGGLLMFVNAQDDTVGVFNASADERAALDWEKVKGRTSIIPYLNRMMDLGGDVQAVAFVCR